MKNLKFKLLLLFIFFSTYSFGQELEFDSKFFPVGYAANAECDGLIQNRHLRPIHLPKLYMFSYSYGKEHEVAQKLTSEGYGKQVLDALLQRDESGLHIEGLYSQALKYVSTDEKDIAAHDQSAETTDVLKKDIAKQLLQNNYIILLDNDGNHTHWAVFHVDITDAVIQQAYLNWNDMERYDQIQVKVSFRAKGSVKSKKSDLIVNKIAHKVPHFTVRGAIIDRHPFLTDLGRVEGVRKNDRVYIYKPKIAKNDKVVLSKIASTRVVGFESGNARLFTISGKFASSKKGEIAVWHDSHKKSISLMGATSFGGDPRFGGRISFENLISFSKLGIAQYGLVSLDYNIYNREPKGVWFDYETKEDKQPNLSYGAISGGYGLGFNFLGRIEVMPYLMVGCQISNFSNSDLLYWDNAQGNWGHFKHTTSSSSYSSDKDEFDIKAEQAFALIGHGGVRVSVNIWYPLQLTFGADYNYMYSLNDKEQVDPFKPIYDRHEMNRVNFYAGIRIHL